MSEPDPQPAPRVRRSRSTPATPAATPAGPAVSTPSPATAAAETNTAETNTAETNTAAATPASAAPASAAPASAGPASTAPSASAETPAVETPSAPHSPAPHSPEPSVSTQTPPAQTPPAQTPLTQTPPAQTPLTQTPLTQTPLTQTPTAQTPPTRHPPAATAPKQRSGAGLLVAGLALGAVVGGASGAGIAAWAVANASGPQQQSVTSPQTITVNDPDAVNVVNAVAAKAGPSVVTIAVSARAGAGSGSGVILSDDGYVLTNNHVITLDGASRDGAIEVTTADGRIFRAEVVGTDPIVDLAVIKLVDASDLTPIEFGDVDSLDVGDRVVAIGAPLGLANTVTDGIVSALDRSIQIASSAVPGDGAEDGDQGGGPDPFNFDIPGQQSTGGSGTISVPVIQTDAAINPGNSGGALVNSSGELVGVNVAIANAGGASGRAGSIGVGFAIPADLAKRVADELIANGVATHGLLGATVRNASSADGSIVGALIDSVTDDGAAAAVGLREGDIVTKLDGATITSSVDLTAQVRLHGAGDKVDLTYVRNGDATTVSVTLGEYSTR